jgi:hypothetical protein
VKRHDTDVTSLVFGLIFLATAAVWPLLRLDVFDVDALPWFAASCLVVIGVVGVGLSVTRGGRDSREPEEPPIY